MVNHFRVWLFAFLIAFNTAQAATGSLEAPLHFGPEVSLPQASHSHSLRVAVWNILKESRSGFEDEFHRLARNSDLMLLQEVLLNTRAERAFASLPDSSWVMAEAWKQNGAPTGTAILSAFQFLFPIGLLSPDTEPVSFTPKSSVSFLVPVRGQKQSLMVVNTHAINFTTNGPFLRQLKSVAQLISRHQGPVIWAGDFNTWRESRWDILYDQTEVLGLKPVAFADEPRKFILDHIFVRGLKVTRAQVLSDFQSSDHWPLYFIAKPTPTSEWAVSR